MQPWRWQRRSQQSAENLEDRERGVYRQLEMPLQEAYAYTAQIMAENMLEEDAKEGIDAFLEKRPGTVEANMSGG